MPMLFPADGIIEPLIVLALAEDLGTAGDVTTRALVPQGCAARAHFINRKDGIIAGLRIINLVFKQLDPKLKAKTELTDGAFAPAGSTLCTIEGSAAAILTGERTALNFLCRLSGIATTTHRLQQKISHTKAKITDTRKTIPALRALEKYAVVCGGGVNHRMGLYDMVMIKDNHLALMNGDIAAAIAAAHAHAPNLPVAVEVENLDQLRGALAAGPDRIMLDNMPVPMMREAVRITAGRRELEATGGITADNIVAVAETGVDYISSGWITHSAPALDIGLDFAPSPKA